MKHIITLFFIISSFTSQSQNYRYVGISSREALHIKEFTKDLHLEKKYQSTDLLKIKALIEASKFDSALIVSDLILTEDQSNPIAHLFKGLSLQSMILMDSALVNYEKAYSLNDNFIEAKYQHSRLLVKMNRLKEAEALINQMKESHSENEYVYLAIASYMTASWKPRTAEKMLEKAIKLNPNLIQPKHELIKIYSQKGSIDELENILNDLIAQGVHSTDIYYQKARIEFEYNSDLYKALEYTKRSLDIDSTDEQALELKVKVLYQLREYFQAYNTLEKLSELKIDSRVIKKPLEIVGPVRFTQNSSYSLKVPSLFDLLLMFKEEKESFFRSSRQTIEMSFVLGFLICGGKKLSSTIQIIVQY